MTAHASRRIILGATLALAIAASLAPLLLGATVALTSPQQFARTGVGVPAPWTLSNFAALFADPTTFVRPVLVTLGAGVIVAAAQTTSSVMAAYALTRFPFAGRRMFVVVLAAAYAVPPVTTVIPLYSWFVGIGLAGTFWALVVPFVLASPYAIFLLAQWMRSVPSEVVDAARVDGGSHATVLLRVVAPMVRPAIATVALVTFVSTWNSYLWPRLIAGVKLPQVQVAVASLQTQFDSNWTLVMAAATVSVVPPIIAALVLHRSLSSAIGTGVSP